MLKARTATGGGPGTSRRCAQCRQRRKKCDLERPCVRCIRTGSECSGPLNETIFIHRTTNDLVQRSDRILLRTAFSARRTRDDQVKTNQHVSEYRIVADQLRYGPCNPHIVNCMIDSVAHKQFYATLISEFDTSLPGDSNDSRSSENTSIYSSILRTINTLASLATPGIRLLDMGIFSLLNLYVGKLRRHNPEQIQLARLAYGSTLEELRRRLTNQDLIVGSRKKDDRYSQLIFCLCLSLSLFEVVDQLGSQMDLNAHLDGASTLLCLTGPMVYITPQVCNAFSGFRGIAIAGAMRRRKKLFLAEAPWLQIPFQCHGKTDIERLHDITMRLPELLERTDQLNLCQDGVATPNEYKRSRRKLVQDYLDLDADMHKWIESLKTTSGKTRETESQTVGGGHAASCTSDASEVIRNGSFTSKPEGGILVHYWTIWLELFMGLSDLHETTRIVGYDEADSQFDLDVYSHVARVVANEILNATSHLSHTTEGQLVVQIPTETVSRYLAKAM